MTQTCGLCGRAIDAAVFAEHLREHQSEPRPAPSRGLRLWAAGCFVSVAALGLSSMMALGVALNNGYTNAERASKAPFIYLTLLAVVAFDLSLVLIGARLAHAGKAAALCLTAAAVFFLLGAAVVGE